MSFPIFDYNTVVVLSGTSLLGAAGGMIGVYLLLRRRALLGDAIAHATLPGLAIAFFVSLSLGGDGRSLGLLLAGAAMSGLLGAICVMLIRMTSVIKEDAAMGIVLSVFFGAGVALLRIIQQLPSGYAAGLESYIYGKTASMTFRDTVLLGITAIFVVLLIIILRRPLELICFDEGLAKSQGWPVTAIDLVLMSATTLVVIVGLQAVGIILIIAMLVIPAATARFWTRRLWPTIAMSAIAGCIGAATGALLSTFIDKIPSGAAIVLCLAAYFCLSAIFGSRGGIAWVAVRRFRQRREAENQHFLRAIYEYLEVSGQRPEQFGVRRSTPFALENVTEYLRWPKSRIHSVAHRNVANDVIVRHTSDQWCLTATGIQLALRAVRQHRLLEMYFARMADMSADAIDRGADYSEHALDDSMIAELERDIAGADRRFAVPESLHPLTSSSTVDRKYGVSIEESTNS